MARIIVDVHLKPEILDPQGRAVQGALGRLGLGAVSSVRQCKQFLIDVERDLDAATSPTPGPMHESPPHTPVTG